MQLSYIFIIIPFVQIISDSLLGIIIDKTGKHKLAFCSSIIVLMIAISSFIMIPETSTTDNSSAFQVCHYIINHPNETDECALHCNNSDIVNMTDIPYDINNIRLCCSRVGEYVTNYSYLANFKIELDGNETNVTCEDMLQHGLSYQEHGEVHDGTILQKTSFRIAFLLIMTALYHVARSNSCRCIEVTAMHMAVTYNSDLGKQYICALIGMAFIPPIFGLIIQLTTYEHKANNYASAFYLYDAISVVLLFWIFKLDVKSPPPAIKMLKKAAFLFKSVDLILFEFIVVIFGFLMFNDMTFIPFYLEQIGASSLLISLKTAIESLIAVPLIIISEWLIIKIGLVNLFIFGLLSSSFNFLVLSFIVNPWWSLACAVLPAFYRALPWVVIIRYAHQTAPEGLTATTISVTGTIYTALAYGFAVWLEVIVWADSEHVQRFKGLLYFVLQCH